MSELRQPVKGKPHFSVRQVTYHADGEPHIEMGMRWVATTADNIQAALNAGGEWARRIDEPWTRWWRQHQETA